MSLPWRLWRFCWLLPDGVIITQGVTASTRPEVTHNPSAHPTAVLTLLSKGPIPWAKLSDLRSPSPDLLPLLHKSPALTPSPACHTLVDAQSSWVFSWDHSSRPNHLFLRTWPALFLPTGPVAFSTMATCSGEAVQPGTHSLLLPSPPPSCCHAYVQNYDQNSKKKKKNYLANKEVIETWPLGSFGSDH